MSDSSGRSAHVPPGCRYYAVGDIHGRADLLDAAIARIEADIAARPVPVTFEVYLGDYVDRGPASSTVVERLIQRRARGNVICLAGNHERMMLSALDTDEAFANWCRFGGLDTLMSYGIGPGAQREGMQELRKQALKTIPEKHRNFLAMLPLYHVAGDYLFVHAGLRPGVALAEQSRDDLTIIREPFLSSSQHPGFVVVHGHTPTRELSVESFRINLDTGAFATGKLTVLALEKHWCWEV